LVPFFERNIKKTPESFFGSASFLPIPCPFPEQQGRGIRTRDLPVSSKIDVGKDQPFEGGLKAIFAVVPGVQKNVGTFRFVNGGTILFLLTLFYQRPGENSHFIFPCKFSQIFWRKFSRRNGSSIKNESKSESF